MSTDVPAHVFHRIAEDVGRAHGVVLDTHKVEIFLRFGKAFGVSTAIMNDLMIEYGEYQAHQT